MPTNGFIDMDKHPYAWAQAFPSLFPPRYNPDDDKWHIYHGYTAWEGIREAKRPTFKQWCEYMMWRNDGAPARHTTFSLVAFNHKLRTLLSKQASFVYSTGDIDPNTTMEEIQQAMEDNDAMRKQIDKMAANTRETCPKYYSTCLNISHMHWSIDGYSTYR